MGRRDRRPAPGPATASTPRYAFWHLPGFVGGMEPVDPPLPSDDPSAPPVSWVGDPLGAPLAAASVDALREVLARHRRRQRVLAGVGMALVLVAGSVAGFAVGQQGRTSTGTQVAAADQPAGPAPVAPNASAPHDHGQADRRARGHRVGHNSTAYSAIARGGVGSGQHGASDIEAPSDSLAALFGDHRALTRGVRASHR